ncbi:MULTISPECIES: DegT/DnrJ/EryC1/StrS family aminotransferase [Mesobacillus]|uniref:DegT/DnrJ/EryC1/StrS family aminotransferase n=1 Tax=Mesobacillus TaxID=2675231 RepID=UPI0017812D62|nr:MULTISPECIES: DegT/DnrJ/EryC1/StrS family aminotransferase [Mesobacillus]MCM3575434.1 DegT/DnrJ/EryC1/StrS family aminotransferase [Mesobacillus subterraneus]UYZ22370.1 DegT/DnrJ/EryC1/StrS family aminotransferase [Mesobacillus jeotgali]
MRIPMVDLKKEYELYGEPIKQSVLKVLESGSYILGERGKQFEDELAKYLGCRYAAGVANGTDALLLALEALGIGAGDEVITTPFTFYATGEMIARAGAEPVFVDIEPETYNIDPDKIEAAITEKTKAIIVVHLFGKAAEMDAIMKIASSYNLKVIEDACQAIGTEHEGKKAGTIGDIGCFSFFPSKNLGAFGDAGMTVTNDKDINDKICQLRNHGSKERYIHCDIGVNSRLDEIQAAVLIEKIKLLDLFLFKRMGIANTYTRELKELVKTPPSRSDREHTYHQYCIESDNRDKLSSHLNDMGIATGIYYPVPLHLQKAFSYLNYKEGDFPVAEKAAKKILALPINPTMTVSDQEFIISEIKKVAGASR